MAGPDGVTNAPAATGTTGARRAQEAAGAGDPTAERILAAAADLFARQGFRATGLRQVAAAAGVAVGTVYAHFPHKQALLAVLLAQAAQRLRRGLAWVWLTPGLPAFQRWSRFRRALVDALPWLACEEEAAGGRACEGEPAPAPVPAPGPVPGPHAQGGTPAAVAREALVRLLEEASRRGEIRLPLPDPGATAEALLGAAVGMWRVKRADALDVLWWGLVTNQGRDDASGTTGVRQTGLRHEAVSGVS